MRNILLIALFTLAFAPNAPAADSGEGEALFEARCALCHQLPDPRQFKAEQWKKVLDVMRLRMEQKGMPVLPEEEKNLIAAYLSENAPR